MSTSTTLARVRRALRRLDDWTLIAFNPQGPYTRRPSRREASAADRP